MACAGVTSEAVAFSPDGTKVATTAGDDSVQLWDAATSKPLGPPLKHKNAVKEVAFSPDGTKLARYATKGPWGCGIWQPSDCPAAPQQHARQGNCRGVQPGRVEVATASDDLFSTPLPARQDGPALGCRTGQPLGQPMKHDLGGDQTQGPLAQGSFSPDGNTLTRKPGADPALGCGDGQPLGPPIRRETSAARQEPPGRRSWRR